jgi:hypothetical protein
MKPSSQNQPASGVKVRNGGRQRMMEIQQQQPNKITVTLEFTHEVSKEQMAVLRTLAFAHDKTLEDYLWMLIRGGARADVETLMDRAVADKIEKLVETGT